MSPPTSVPDFIISEKTFLQLSPSPKVSCISNIDGESTREIEPVESKALAENQIYEEVIESAENKAGKVPIL